MISYTLNTEEGKNIRAVIIPRCRQKKYVTDHFYMGTRKLCELKVLHFTDFVKNTSFPLHFSPIKNYAVILMRPARGYFILDRFCLKKIISIFIRLCCDLRRNSLRTLS